PRPHRSCLLPAKLSNSVFGDERPRLLPRVATLGPARRRELAHRVAIPNPLVLRRARLLLVVADVLSMFGGEGGFLALLGIDRRFFVVFQVRGQVLVVDDVQLLVGVSEAPTTRELSGGSRDQALDR